MSTLPLLRVKTNHSEYIIDQNAGTYSRRAVHDDASHLYNRSAGEVRLYVEAYGLAVGEQIYLVEPSGAWVRSTPVVSIEEVPGE